MLAMAAVAMSPWLLPSSPHTSFNVAAVLLAPGSTKVSLTFRGFKEIQWVVKIIFSHGWEGI